MILSPIEAAREIREYLAYCPQSPAGHGPGMVRVVGGQRLWVCPDCCRRISARGFGYFSGAGWVQPDGRDDGRQCVGDCGRWQEVRS